MRHHTTSTRTIASLAALAAAGALIITAGTTANAAPGNPGQPAPAKVVFHEDFELAPDSGPRTMLDGYGGGLYTADNYWLNAAKANGMVLSWGNTAVKGDGTGAQNGTEDTAFATLRQLTEALGKVNGSADPQKNTAISAYTQSTGTAPVGGKVMFATTADNPITVADGQGRFLAFSMSAAATNCRDKDHPDRRDPQYELFVSQNGVETKLSTSPINPCTDKRAQAVTVSKLADGTKNTVYAGQFASEDSFLYDGAQFGFVVRNKTSEHLGDDGAFDDIKVLDVTPQLDKQFGTAQATTGQPVRLTFTVTNTDELANKKGWAFTDQLPEGLVIASEPNLVVDGTATVVAEPGTNAISVTDGDLAVGDNALTISLDVTSSAAGVYTNGPDNITVRKGLDSPDVAKVEFVDPTPDPAHLVVQYLDTNGNPLAPQDESDGHVGDKYDTAAKDIPGYELVAIPTNQSGQLDKGTTTVVYVYQPIPAPKTGDLVVRWLDENGNDLAQPEFTSAPVGDKYSSFAKDFPGYTLQSTTGAPSGLYVEGTTEVVYRYKPVPAPLPGDVIVKYVDENGHEIASRETSSGAAGQDYDTHAKDIDGYTLVSIPDNKSGQYAEGATTTVVYEYKKNAPAPASADLTVRWITEDGTDLATPLAYTGIDGEAYTTESKTFPGYTLVAVPTNAAGELDAAAPTSVVYVFTKDAPAPAPADLTVRFVDEQGNALADPTHRDGIAGEHYDTTPAVITGYELVAVPQNASGELQPGTEVVYVYKKVVTPVEPVDPVDPVDPADPVDEPVNQVSAQEPISQVLAADLAPVTASGGRLASTGSSAGALGGIAAALALAGATLTVVAARRRRDQKEC